MKELIDIPEESIRYAKEIPNTYCKWLLSHNDIVRAIKLGIPIPDNATNGDMIKAMLNPYKVCEYEYSVHVYMTEEDFWKSDYQMNCNARWWNAQYGEKRGNENN